jgi:DNA-binding transcriptional LysR family regulator
MAKNTPDWHLYRAYFAVMREGSLSGAARMLGMTQPTVGRQVAALEAALGISLFARSLDGLAPTDAALRLRPAAEAMAAAAEMAQRLTSGEFDEERGTVRITASEVMGAEVLPPILARFHERYPAIALELALTDRNEDLLRGDADLAVRMIKPTQDVLIAKKIGRIDVALYAHRRYLKAHGQPQLRKELAGHTLIGSDRDPAFMRLADTLKLPRDAFLFRSDSQLAQLAALRAGFGIGPCQLGIARRDKDLLPVLHADLTLSMETWLAMHRDLRGNRRLRLVFDHLATELASYARSSNQDTRAR